MDMLIDEALLAPYRGMTVGVAVSGGMDSMCLLHWTVCHAAALGIRPVALHFDHAMRAGSDGDAAFVLSECEKTGTVCVAARAAAGECTSEDTARRARYAFLQRAAAQTGCACVLTAHHARDQAETVLLHLLRGAGTGGACGMSGVARIAGGTLPLLRPMLGVTYADIRTYATAHTIPFVTDPTNADPRYSRNAVRGILRAFEASFPDAAAKLAAYARRAEADERFFDALLPRLDIRADGVSLPLGGLTAPPALAVRLAKKALVCLGVHTFTENTLLGIVSLASMRTGAKYQTAALTAVRDANGVHVCKATGAPPCTQEGAVPFSYGDIPFAGGLVRVTPCDPSAPVLPYFDADKVPPTAVLRFRRDGDVLEKLGGGAVPLKKWFIDQKIPARLRGGIPLVADGDRVLVIGGRTTSACVKVDNGTKNVYTIRYEPRI
ncbi:MAG: tRNA lysidine(34) synthetase TilS [Clostridiales bacterium]|jgi:tRNA(Ile)-lysidine synthase|nr:tRNA lysidine(34) synthetase TilS [Clostridiales bacterium]